MKIAFSIQYNTKYITRFLKKKFLCTNQKITENKSTEKRCLSCKMNRQTTRLQFFVNYYCCDCCPNVLFTSEILDFLFVCFFNQEHFITVRNVCFQTVALSVWWKKKHKIIKQLLECDKVHRVLITMYKISRLEFSIKSHHIVSEFWKVFSLRQRKRKREVVKTDKRN